MSALPITVFFDFTCPFSYVAMAALERVSAATDVELRARALERFPAPVPQSPPADDPGWEEARRRAAELDVPMRRPDFRPRTRKAHEAVAFAGERGAAAEMRSAIFAAYWAEERDIGRIDVLSSLAPGLGLDPDDLRVELDVDRHGPSVLHDEALAERLRIVRTPTLFVGTGPDARILVGAPSEEELEAAILSFGP